MIPPSYMLEVYNMPQNTPKEIGARDREIDRVIIEPRRLARDNSLSRRIYNNIRVALGKEPCFESRKMRMLYSQNPLFK